MCIFPKYNRPYELQDFRTKWLFLKYVKVIHPLKDDLIHHSVWAGGGGWHCWPAVLNSVIYTWQPFTLRFTDLKITSFEFWVYWLEIHISQLGNVRVKDTWKKCNPVPIFMIWWKSLAVWDSSINLSGFLSVFHSERSEATWK